MSPRVYSTCKEKKRNCFPSNPFSRSDRLSSSLAIKICVLSSETTRASQSDSEVTAISTRTEFWRRIIFSLELWCFFNKGFVDLFYRYKISWGTQYCSSRCVMLCDDRQGVWRFECHQCGSQNCRRLSQNYFQDPQGFPFQNESTHQIDIEPSSNFPNG